MGFVDVLEQFGARLVEESRGLVVAVLHGDVVRLFEGESGLEVLLGLGQGFEFFVGGYEIGVGIALAPFVLGVETASGKKQGRWKLREGVRTLLEKACRGAG